MSSHEYLLKHVQDSHSERPQGRLQCSFCSYSTNRRSRLTEHEQTHTDDRPFSCPSCHKNFTRKNGLIKHLRVHTGEKPYECTICGRQFRESSVLSRHMRLLHLDHGKPHACRFCAQAFRHKVDLTKHLGKCGRKFAATGTAGEQEGLVCCFPTPPVGSASPKEEEIVVPE